MAWVCSRYCEDQNTKSAVRFRILCACLKTWGATQGRQLAALSDRVG